MPVAVYGELSLRAAALLLADGVRLGIVVVLRGSPYQDAGGGACHRRSQFARHSEIRRRRANPYIGARAHPEQLVKAIELRRTAGQYDAVVRQVFDAAFAQLENDEVYQFLRSLACQLADVVQRDIRGRSAAVDGQRYLFVYLGLVWQGGLPSTP